MKAVGLVYKNDNALEEEAAVLTTQLPLFISALFTILNQTSERF